VQWQELNALLVKPSGIFLNVVQMKSVEAVVNENNQDLQYRKPCSRGLK
jgi:hypothetical protein